MNTSKYIFNGHVEAKMKPVEPRFATSCLICDEDIPVWDFELGQPKICEKCKTTVMKMRKLVFDEGKSK